jgi:hypothetical protein
MKSFNKETREQIMIQVWDQVWDLSEVHVRIKVMESGLGLVRSQVWDLVLIYVLDHTRSQTKEAQSEIG